MRQIWGKKVVLTIAASSLLAGCMTDQGSSPPDIPLIAREYAARMILAQRGGLWKDPPSIRDAKLTDPIFCPANDLASLPAEYGSTCACVEANAKNGFGGYTGLHRTVIIFPLSGELATSDAGLQGFAAICNASMTPFPELNGDYIEPKPGKKPRRPVT